MTKPVALLFPGQGSQYVGMGKKLYDNFVAARQTFEEANDTLGYDLRKLCFEGDAEELTQTEHAQPAILTASVAAYRVFVQEYGTAILLGAGHSLGEYSALACAGAIPFADAVRLVRLRGIYMQEAVGPSMGAMAAVMNVSADQVEETCNAVSGETGVVVVSNYNSPNQTVISGSVEAVRKAVDKLSASGAQVVPLRVSAPFHSPLMEPAALKLAEELKRVPYQDLQWPVLSNVTARPYEDKQSIAELLTAQMTNAVQWSACMEFLRSQGVTLAVEMGPQTVLRNLLRNMAPTVTALAFDKEEDVYSLGKLLAVPNTAHSGQVYDTTVVIKCLAIAVCTRNRNWDNDEYHQGVVLPYRNIQRLQDELDAAGRMPTHEEMKQALDMLVSVFKTKRVPLEEQVERFHQVFDETGTRHLFPDFISDVVREQEKADQLV